MASVKFLALIILALFAISMLETVVAKHGHGGHHKNRGNGKGQRQRGYGNGSLKPGECKPECDRRCGETQYHKPCIFFCNKCCNTCLCVPPGPYGNKQLCPCYNNWKTKEGGPKCP